MPKRSRKLPADPNQRARAVVDLATDPPEPAQQPAPPPGATYVAKPAETTTEPVKNPAAVALGKLGGAKGGPARARKLSKKRRAEIAKKAAAARWGRKP